MQKTINLPEQEATATFKRSTLRVLWFRVQLAIVLFVRGRLRYYSAYYAHAVNETADFTSYGFVKRRNPWGMRPDQNRKKWYRAEDNGFAVYSCYWMAAQDRLAWDREYYPFKGNEDAYFASFPYAAWYGGDVDDAEWIALRDGMVSTMLKVKKAAQVVTNVAVWLLVGGIAVAVVWIGYRLYKALKRK